MSQQASRFWQFLKPLRHVGSSLVFLAVALVAFSLGYILKGGLSPEPPEAPASVAAQESSAEETAQFWTCSMHPQIRQPKPGRCPICGMDLVPVSGGGGEMSGTRRFTTSEAAKELMNIQTSLVERRFVTTEVRMVGKVEIDETRLAYITAWVPGRLDRLYVDYTGIEVRKGDHMVYLYSPDLLVAQDELRRAVHALETLRPDAHAVVAETAESTLEAVRNKLRLWGLTPAQIAEAEKTGRLSDHITIYAPIGGTVIHRDGQEGMYVNTGTRIYTLADLDEVWVKLDAYESNLVWLRYGQTVEFTTEAYPGEIFEGRIAFIDPILDKRTRTVKVRVNVPNPDGKLKPEMFVRAVVRTKLATGGRVTDPGLSGKWIGPMHPEIVKDEPGACDICGMPLVRAEELGYVAATADESAKPLVIPASAPLITGKRAVVYVEAPDTEQPTFDGREVVLGPRAGDYYIVRSGLSEGERVVTNGNFKIDSALQIMAKPSMMTPEGGGGGDHDHGGEAKKAARDQAEPAVGLSFTVTEEFQVQLRGLYDSYLGLHGALAGDKVRRRLECCHGDPGSARASGHEALGRRCAHGLDEESDRPGLSPWEHGKSPGYQWNTVRSG